MEEDQNQNYPEVEMGKKCPVIVQHPLTGLPMLVCQCTPTGYHPNPEAEYRMQYEKFQ